MKVSFTKRAQKNYFSIIDFLSENWENKAVEAFEQKALNFFDLLKNYPALGSLELSEKGIRGFQLTKQTRVLYELKVNESLYYSFSMFDKTQIRSLPNFILDII